MKTTKKRYIIYICSIVIALLLVITLHGFHLRELRFGNFIIVILLIFVFIFMELKFIKNKNKKS